MPLGNNLYDRVVVRNPARIQATGSDKNIQFRPVPLDTTGLYPVDLDAAPKFSTIVA